MTNKSAVLVRMPAPIKAALSAQATKNFRTLNAEILMLLIRHLGEENQTGSSSNA